MGSRYTQLYGNVRTQARISQEIIRANQRIRFALIAGIVKS